MDIFLLLQKASYHKIEDISAREKTSSRFKHCPTKAMEEKFFEAITGGDYGTCEQLLDQGVNIEAIHKVSVNDADDDYAASSIVSYLSVCVVSVRMDALLFIMRHIMDLSRSLVFF